ncbi:hypothetical protein BDZ91DRAFT_510236 [Kalaharituber pfeilii]|nr:hypothetical protein BDZ91DRAFT_510236 [Kalaharituber pfeilii]
MVSMGLSPCRWEGCGCGGLAWDRDPAWEWVAWPLESLSNLMIRCDPSFDALETGPVMGTYLPWFFHRCTVCAFRAWILSDTVGAVFFSFCIGLVLGVWLGSFYWRV